jgi:tetratricopeptide (TPR) repeat protein
MEITLDQALQKGIEAHKTGKVQEADRYYTAILKANPKHPDANHNMGVLAVGVGKVPEALPFFKKALEVNPNIDQFWLSYIDALIKLDRITDAKTVFDQAKSKGATGDGFDKLEKCFGSLNSKNSNIKDVPQEQLNSLINLYTKRLYKETFNQAAKLLINFPESVNLYNILGAAHKGLGRLEEAIEAYAKALSINPHYAEVYNNMGNALQEQGKLEQAIEAYTKAISIIPDYAEAHNNTGAALKEQGKLEEAIEAYTKAISINSDYAEAYYNIGLALQEQGKSEEAIEAYTKAISIIPDYAVAHNNMGAVLQEQGKLEEAIEVYTKALSIKPDHAEAHRNLSVIKKYEKDDKQINQVQELYEQEDLSEDAKCHLSFALAKMYEDTGDIEKSFAGFTEGNSLRKQLLNYSIDQDKSLFTKLKNTQPQLLKKSLKINEKSIDATPIFILGMPRSGTTLVEQIVSSHSEVLGAGELSHISKLGLNLAVGSTSINTATISEFRGSYLSELSKVSDEKHLVTDKMPQNFRFIPLICAAFPEAKIVHVQRNAIATCWSNYKQYFVSKDLGYCYDLSDVIEYYTLYKDLMKLWQSEYSNKLYNLNYETLTTDQENQTRKLIEHLGLSWEDVCLSPQKNNRSVRTASSQQVRQKVYKGSSQAWRKYEPHLNGVFDKLQS